MSDFVTASCKSIAGESPFARCRNYVVVVALKSEQTFDGKRLNDLGNKSRKAYITIVIDNVRSVIG
jgi:hypothetical protein